MTPEELFAEGYTELIVDGLLVKAPEEKAKAKNKKEGEGRG